MAAEQTQVWTVTRIAERLGVSRFRVEYAISSRRIMPSSRAGIARIFDEAALGAIEAAICEIQTIRERGHRVAGEEACTP